VPRGAHGTHSPTLANMSEDEYEDDFEDESDVSVSMDGKEEVGEGGDYGRRGGGDGKSGEAGM